MKFLLVYLILMLGSLFKSFGQEQDWPDLKHYKQENAKLIAPAEGEQRIVFMGNSITEGWIDQRPVFFTGKPYVNRGISGQTTPQMLLRFRQDVIALQPSVVVILAGINDIAGNTGPSTLDMIMNNLISMCQLAAANQIRVVLCSVLPANKFSWSPDKEPADEVIRLNTMIKAYAEEKGHIHVDYYSAMVDEQKGLRSELGGDGVHPNEAGYLIMEPLVEEGIAAALAK